MAIKITIPSSVSPKITIPTSVSSNRVITNTTNNSKQVTSAKVEQLANIDISNGLQDGYTLVYDEPTGKWVAQQIEFDIGADQFNLESLDGGTY
jgi:hypothetical protein